MSLIEISGETVRSNTAPQYHNVSQPHTSIGNIYPVPLQSYSSLMIEVNLTVTLFLTANLTHVLDITLILKVKFTVGGVQGVVPQSDLSPTIILSRCYNDLNFFLRLTACSTKTTLPYGHRRLRLKAYNR